MSKNKNTEDIYKFSEHAIIQALNFNEQLRFCTFSIQIHVVNFDPMANLTCTFEEKNTRCTFELLKDIIMKHEGRKQVVRSGQGKGLWPIVKVKIEEVWWWCSG